LFAQGLPISVPARRLGLLLALVIGGARYLAALRQNGAADYVVIGFATAGSTIPTFVVAPVIQLLFGLTWPAADRRLERRRLPQPHRPDRDAGSAADRHRRPADARLDDRDRCAPTTSAPLRALGPLGMVGGGAARAARRAPADRLLRRTGGGALLTGSIIVETIFGIPGVGRYFVDAALNRDYTLVMGTVVVIAIFVHALQPDRRHPLCRRRPAGAL
jgi:oligopeptide transport system permease protein